MKFRKSKRSFGGYIFSIDVRNYTGKETKKPGKRDQETREQTRKQGNQETKKTRKARNQEARKPRNKETRKPVL